MRSCLPGASIASQMMMMAMMMMMMTMMMMIDDDDDDDEEEEEEEEKDPAVTAESLPSCPTSSSKTTVARTGREVVDGGW